MSAAPAFARTPFQTFSPEELEERRHRLGASEVPVVAGYVSFKSSLQLWAEKRGLIPPFEGNEFTEWGNRLEPVIADKYAEVVGLHIEEVPTIVDLAEPWRSCTPDRLVGHGERGLEIKCRGEYRGDEWGVPGTDQVPPDVAIQCHVSMHITGIKRWDVATLIGGNKFGLYHLFFDEDIARSLLEISRDFWKHVQEGTEPPIDASAATTEFLARRFPKNDEVLRQATPEESQLIADILDVREQIKELEKREAFFGNQLRQAIGENAGIEAAVGRATWKAPNGTTVAWKDVAEQLGKHVAPEVLAAAVKAHSNPMGRRFIPYPPSKSKKVK